MRKTLILLSVIGLLTALALTASGCGVLTSQAEVNKARDAQKKAEIELAKTKQELADVKAELAGLKGKGTGTTTESGGATGSGSSTGSGGSGGGGGSSGSSAYTPSKGSATRQAILDSVRSAISWTKLFKVNHLKVKGSWAYGELQQYDPSKPSNAYEGFSTLLHKVGGSWTVVWTGAGSDIEDIETKNGMSIEKWLQKKYGAPPEIF